jgi:hypothetical protein
MTFTPKAEQFLHRAVDLGELDRVEVFKSRGRYRIWFYWTTGLGHEVANTRTKRGARKDAQEVSRSLNDLPVVWS